MLRAALVHYAVPPAMVSRLTEAGGEDCSDFAVSVWLRILSWEIFWRGDAKSRFLAVEA